MTTKTMKDNKTSWHAKKECAKEIAKALVNIGRIMHESRKEQRRKGKW